MHDGHGYEPRERSWERSALPELPDAAQPLGQQPSATPVVFGVLSLVFAILNGLGQGASILQVLFMQSRLHETALSGSMGSIFTATRNATLAQGSVMILMDVALVVVGLLLLQRREVGRKLAIGWAIAAFVVLVGRALLFELYLFPVFVGAIAAGSGGSFAFAGGGTMGLYARAGTYGTLVFMALFPLALLIVMNVPSVKASLRRRPSP